MTIEDRLSILEEVVAQRSKADPSVAVVPTLEERVTRLEGLLRKDLRIDDSLENDPDGSGAGNGLGMTHGGSSQALDCETSVMAPLANWTRLQWHRDQFSFETLFKSPQIFLAAFQIDRNQRRFAASPTNDRIEYILGSLESRVRTMSISQGREESSGEMACWLPLLERLHRNEWELHRHGCYYQHLLDGSQGSHGRLVGRAVRFHENSRDSMPLKPARPFAVTTISDIAVIARRLGMSWRTFNPEGGSMKADGNGHGLSFTLARSFGLVMQYIHLEGGATSTEKSLFPDVEGLSMTELYIPTHEADMMGFGILPGCDRLNVPCFKVGTTAEVYATMDLLDSTCKASNKLRDVNRLLVGKWDAHCMYGFSDIIAIAAPMIRRRHSTIVRVPTPAEYCSSLLSHKECFVVFYNRLKEYLGTRSKDVLFEQAEWVLKKYEQLQSRYSEWENEAENNNQVNDCDLNFLEEVHDSWDATTAYFVQLQETNLLKYLDLMASHISHAVNYWGDAWQRLDQGKARDNYGLRAVEAEGAHLYFDYLPLIVENMRRKGFDGPEKVMHEAWFTLMFRAFCWWRCHSLHPGEDPTYKSSTLPSRYWGCKLPVYIG